MTTRREKEAAEQRAPGPRPEAQGQEVTNPIPASVPDEPVQLSRDEKRNPLHAAGLLGLDLDACRLVEGGVLVPHRDSRSIDLVYAAYGRAGLTQSGEGVIVHVTVPEE